MSLNNPNNTFLTGAYTSDTFKNVNQDRLEEAYEAKRLIDEQVENGGAVTGNLLSMGAEIGGGLFLGHKLHRSAKFAQTAKYVNRTISTLRTAKTVGAVAATPTDPITAAPTLLGGAITYGVAEAGIWGLSNLAGQTIRKGYGIQEDYSVGEALGASVFGLSIVNNKAEKLYQLGEASLSSLKLWKTKEYVSKGAKFFVTGAALGAAETAVRQEVQLLLNERENREVVEYYWGAGLGGAFNTGFGLIASTGKWGRKFAGTATEKAIKRVKTDLKALQTEKLRLEALGKKGAVKKITKLIQEKEQAIVAIEDLQKSVEEADARLSQLETPEGINKVEADKAPPDPLESIPDKPSTESKLEGTPDASNARETQVGNTTNTYNKAASILNQNSGGRTLDYGSGRGKGSEAIGSDSYEPFPREGYEPTYKDNEQIADESYEKIVNLSVLNVVPPDVREGIVKEIGRILTVNGEAIISARTINDVSKAKNKVPFEGEENAFLITNNGKQTYQKGFTNRELLQYVQQTLGDDFEVTLAPKTPDGNKINGAAILVKKIKSSLDAPAPTPAPAKTNAELEDIGNAFLEQEGLTLDDFIIDPIDGTPALKPVSGAGGSRKPTIIEIALYRQQTWDASNAKQSGSIKATFKVSRQSRTSFYDFVETLKTKGQEVINYGPKTQAYLDVLFKLQDKYPEAFKSTLVKTERDGTRAWFTYPHLRQQSPTLRLAKGDTINAIVHETVHAVTSRTLYDELSVISGINKLTGESYLKALREAREQGNIKSEGVGELIDLYLTVIERLGLPKHIRTRLNKIDQIPTEGYNYAIGDLHEFLAEGMSDPTFQRELASIQFKRKGRSGWSEFKRLVVKILGFDAPAGSALDEVLSVTEKIAKENDVVQRFYNKRNELRSKNLSVAQKSSEVNVLRRARDLELARLNRHKLPRWEEGEILPPDAESITESNLPKYDKDLFGEGVETKKFKLNKTNRQYEGEIDGEPYNYPQYYYKSAVKAGRAAAFEHVTKKVKQAISNVRDGDRLVSVKDRLEREGDVKYDIKIEGLDPLFEGKVGIRSTKEISITDKDGNPLSYADLPADLQREIRLFLKHHGGRYKNPAQEPDVGTPADEVFDEQQMLIDFEHAPTPPAEPPVEPPLTAEGANSPDDDPRITELRELEKRLEGINKKNISTKLPAIERAVKAMDRNSKEDLVNILSSLGDLDEMELEALKSFVREIRFMRRMNKVRDLVETTGGRIVQAARKDAERFATSATYSLRSYKEDEALAQLEELANRLIKGKGTDEDDSLTDLLTDFLDEFFDDEPSEFFEPFRVEEEVKILDAEDADVTDADITQVDEEITPPVDEEVTPPVDDEGKPTAKPKKPRKKKNNSLTLEEKLLKQEAKIKRAIEKLEKRLEAARSDFVAERPLKRTLDAEGNEIEGSENTDLGLEDELIDKGSQEPKPKKQKDPRIERLQKLLSFYNKARTELNVLIELKRKRARLAALEGSGDISLIKKELESGLTGPKPPKSVDEVRKDITEIRKRMRQRLKEIERAQKQIEAENSVDTAARIKKKLQQRKDQLQKRLDAYRERFTERGPTDDVPTLEVRRIEDEQTKELERQIKFYQRAEKEAAEAEKLSAELARLADIEGRSVISELEATTRTKPKGPVSPTKVKQLRKKINESKARMRKKLRDLEKARIEMQREELFASMEKYFYKSLETDIASRFSRYLMKARQLRQLALIDQLPSVLAGVPTGIYGVAKQVFRIPAKFISAMANGQGVSIAKQLAGAEFRAMGYMFSDMGDLVTTFKRSFLLNESVTDNMAGKMEIEGQNAIPRGVHAMVVKSRMKASRKAQAAGNVAEKLVSYVRMGNIMNILSLGVRGIIGVDDAFKRMIVKGRIYAESSRRALLEFPDDPVKMKKRAQEIYETAWRDQDGLPVLADILDFSDELNNVRTELLFASNADNIEDVAESMIEPFIRAVQNMAKDNGFTGTLINAFLPFFGVATRGVYRSGRLVLFPLLAARAFRTPYVKKRKELLNELRGYEIKLTKDPKGAIKEGVPETIAAYNKRLDEMDIRELKYKEELLTDIMVGTTLATTGLLAGASGSMTGSLSFLSNEERKKLRGLKDPVNQYRMFGMDYKAALPVTFPLAIYADVGAFLRIRRIQAQTGQPILDPDLTLLSVMQRSFLGLVKELPLTSGINTFEQLTSEDNTRFEESLQRLLNSYIPVPAQLRKIVNTITVDGKVANLKGGSYYERTAYQVLGVGPMNYQTDVFGFDLQTDANWVTDTTWRQAPRFGADKPEDPQIRLTYERFEKILASDSQSQISKKPRNLTSGIAMNKWVDEDGVTLEYHFSQVLKTVKLPRGGQNLTMLEAVSSVLDSSEFKTKYEKGWLPSETNPEKFENEGLELLNDTMKRYYTQARNNIIRDKITRASFINEEEVSLDTFMNQTLQQFNNVRPAGKPFSLQDFFNL